MKLRGGGGGGEAKGQVINFWIRSESLCLCAIVMGGFCCLFYLFALNYKHTILCCNSEPWIMPNRPRTRFQVILRHMLFDSWATTANKPAVDKHSAISDIWTMFVAGLSNTTVLVLISVQKNRCYLWEERAVFISPKSASNGSWEQL